MPVTVRRIIRVAIASAVALLVFGAPQAVATPGPRVDASADPDTREFAATHPDEVAAAATACGSGYGLVRAVPLPKGTDPSMRLGTLFAYVNANNRACAIMDNNTGSAQDSYLRLCDMNRKNCDVDQGRFTQYAGPVYTTLPVCAWVTARMGGFINYESQYVFACN